MTISALPFDSNFVSAFKTLIQISSGESSPYLEQKSLVESWLTILKFMKD